MSPPGNGSPKIRPPHLHAVPPPSETAEPPRSEASGSIPPDSASEIVLPPRQVDPQALRALINGRTRSSYFESLSRFLGELSNPGAGGAYELHLDSDRLRYVIRQAGTGAPITMSVAQDRRGVIASLLEMSYLPDGTVTSSAHPEVHDALRGPEKSHHGILQGLMSRRAEGLLSGTEWYERLGPALEGLEGRYHPESRSLRFDNFAVDHGTIYSFVIQNAAGPREMAKNPYFPQIQIFAETLTAGGAQKTLVMSLSPGGEINFDPSRSAREVLSDPQRDLLRRLTASMESAVHNPQAYQITLGRSLQRVAGSAPIEIPTISPSTRIGANAGAAHGVLGEPILEIHSAFDLFRNFHPLAGHRWQNPANAEDVRNLRPSLRLSRVMGREWMRWAFSGPYHWIFRGLTEARQKGDHLRLHLFPSGGGELTLYRHGELHDIISEGPDRKAWRASEEITQLEISGERFPTRYQALEAAVARRNAALGGTDPLRIQRAPAFDLDQFFRRADGGTEPIRDTETAWRLLQAQIPSGIEPRVLSDVNFRGQVNNVQVDFFGSEPSVMLRVKHNSVPTGTGETVPRVVIFLERGADRHTRVFEDGRLRPDLSADVLRRAMAPAEPRGAYRYLRPLLNVGHFYGVRRVAWAFADGLPYAFGHYASQYGVRAYESVAYTEAERRLIGTPAPHYNLNNFLSQVVSPYAKMALFAGVGSLMVDGVYNTLISRAGRAMEISAANSVGFRTAWRSAPSSWFNSNPIARPIRSNVLHRFFQRGVPLIFGLVGPEFFTHHTVNVPQFLQNLKYIGVASAATSGLTLLGTTVRPFSRGLVRLGLMESAGIGIRGASFTTTLRGSLVLAAIEFTIMGIMASRDRRAEMTRVRQGLQSSLGQAIDRRNELISQLERGIEVPPADLMEADQAFQQAQAVYRRYLELDERLSGTGRFESIGMENDFLDAYESSEREDTLLAGAAGVSGASALTLASLRSTRDRRLADLRERRERMDSELRALYARHGVSPDATPRPTVGLREWVRGIHDAAEAGTLAAGTPGSSDTATATPRAPVSVDSMEGRAILEQFRWKAAHDTSFILWSPERRARYLLREFRGYRVREADGTARPWNLGEAMAFLATVDQANARRLANMEAPLTLPRESDGFNMQPLRSLFTEEQAIRDREMSAHSHAREHAGRLAENVADFDRQMEAYLQRSNDLTARALERFLEPAATVAALTGTGTATDPRPL